jgi:hypothetical protein
MMFNIENLTSAAAAALVVVVVMMGATLQIFFPLFMF